MLGGNSFHDFLRRRIHEDSKNCRLWFPHRHTQNYSLQISSFFKVGAEKRFANCVLKFGKAPSSSKRILILILLLKGAVSGSHLAECSLTGGLKKDWKRRSPSDQPLIGSTGIAHGHLQFCSDAHYGVYASWRLPIMLCSCRMLLQRRMSLNLEDIGMYQSKMLYTKYPECKDLFQHEPRHRVGPTKLSSLRRVNGRWLRRKTDDERW